MKRAQWQFELSRCSVSSSPDRSSIHPRATAARVLYGSNGQAKQSSERHKPVRDSARYQQIVRILAKRAALFASSPVRIIDPGFASMVHAFQRALRLLCQVALRSSLIVQLRYRFHRPPDESARVPVVKPLCQTLNSGLQLHHEYHQLSTVRLFTCSVHKRCLSVTMILRNPGFREAMESCPGRPH